MINDDVDAIIQRGENELEDLTFEDLNNISSEASVQHWEGDGMTADNVPRCGRNNQQA